MMTPEEIRAIDDWRFEEHVHVHEGGQAIVGNVETGGGARIQVSDVGQLFHWVMGPTQN
jgi:hypothetical protein